jgi:hypothetical protein
MINILKLILGRSMMKNLKIKHTVFGIIVLSIIMTFFFSIFTVAIAQQPNWQAVEKVFGQKGVVEGDVFKITFPRSDLRVKIGEISIEPGLALTSWVAFKPIGSQTMIMGDLVLLDREVIPVMSKLVASGVEVTGLHNHIINESPRVMYMHYYGQGEPTKLAETMKAVIAYTKTPLTPPQPKQPSSTIDWTKVESILGWTGQHKGNLLQISVPRAETITENGMDIPPSMGVTNTINFQMVGEKAATTGDFVLISSEVNPVVKALTEHGIAVTAIHNHMLTESPRLFFLHFWAVDESEKLAQGLKAALDKINSAKRK